MDQFTFDHLVAWMDSAVRDEYRSAFLAWVVDQVEDDPTLADLGWPALYRVWEQTL
jgi:hypothetical protein